MRIASRTHRAAQSPVFFTINSLPFEALEGWHSSQALEFEDLNAAANAVKTANVASAKISSHSVASAWAACRP